MREKIVSVNGARTLFQGEKVELLSEFLGWQEVVGTAEGWQCRPGALADHGDWSQVALVMRGKEQTWEIWGLNWCLLLG